MDDTGGTSKKKSSAISARPVRAPKGRGPAVPVAAGPPAQSLAQPAALQTAEKSQIIDAEHTQSGSNVKGYIERQLKSVYDDVLNQPIPDRFLELLNTLDKATMGKEPRSED